MVTSSKLENRFQALDMCGGKSKGVHAQAFSKSSPSASHPGPYGYLKLHKVVWK